jgi:hypothetical protein
MARAGWPDGGDAAVYSMLSQECRWLPARVPADKKAFKQGTASVLPAA